MNDELRLLNSIDFLPESYRVAKIKRTASVWRLLVALLFGAMLSSAAVYQQRLLWHAQEDLAQVDVLHAVAVASSKQLAEEQANLLPCTSQAELVTYMRHPWPRTQVINALLAPLPESARLTSLQLGYEMVEKRVVEGSLALGKEEPVDKTPSPARDLKRLRGELDGGRWVISLNGSTNDVAELHVYLGTVEKNKLFAKVVLVSIESPSSAEQEHSRFAVRITLRPGYGQPGGPALDATTTQTAKAMLPGGKR